jgi:type II secretory ATPase GspE/PulE/Tfp pilus assembly ATPase PilB-like protein
VVLLLGDQACGGPLADGESWVHCRSRAYKKNLHIQWVIKVTQDLRRVLNEQSAHELLREQHFEIACHEVAAWAPSL